MPALFEKHCWKESRRLYSRVKFRIFDVNTCTGCLTNVRLRTDPKPDLDNANVGMQASQFPIC